MANITLSGRILPLQPLMINVPTDGPVLNKTVYVTPVRLDGGQQVMVPYFTGSNVKGAMRNAGGLPALCEIYGATPGQVETYGVLSIPQVYNASCGGLVAARAQRAIDLVRNRTNRQRDLHSAVFGSMRLNVSGSIQVHHAMPDPLLIGGSLRDVLGRQFGARKDAYRGDPSLLNRHSDEEVKEFLDLQDRNKALSKLRTQRKKAEAEVKNLQRKKDATEAEKEQLEAFRTEVEELKGQERELQVNGAEAIGRTLDPVDYIPQGLSLNHKIRLVNAGYAEIGYFLHCLRHFSLACRLGARASTGYGEIAMEYEVSVNDGGFDLAEAGSLRVSPYEYTLDTHHGLIDKCRDAFEEARLQPQRFFDLTIGLDERKDEPDGE